MMKTKGEMKKGRGGEGLGPTEGLTRYEYAMLQSIAHLDFIAFLIEKMEKDRFKKWEANPLAATVDTMGIGFLKPEYW